MITWLILRISKSHTVLFLVHDSQVNNTIQLFLINDHQIGIFSSSNFQLSQIQLAVFFNRVKFNDLNLKYSGKS